MEKTLQYRQINFLRLFRLCKNMGIIKRKRKMPNEYKDANQKTAGKKLVHAVIKELFPNYDVKSDSAYYYITIPKNINEVLSSLGTKPRSYFANAGAEGEEALRRFGSLRQNMGGHIFPIFPYEIKVSVINTETNSRYNTLIRNGTRTCRPREDFYSCAKFCVEYKKLWEEHAQHLVDFFIVEEGRQKEREAEALLQKQERRRAERLRLEQEKMGIAASQNKKSEEPKKEEPKKEELKKLEEQIEKEKQIKITNAQGSFNQALERFMRPNNG